MGTLCQVSILCSVQEPNTAATDRAKVGEHRQEGAPTQALIDRIKLSSHPITRGGILDTWPGDSEDCEFVILKSMRAESPHAAH